MASMHRALTGNLPLKIISVVVGLVMYLFVMQEKEAERRYQVSVEIVEVPTGYVLVSEVPDVRVTVTGRARNLARLGDILAPIELHFTNPTSHRRFSGTDFVLPAGVEVLEVYPEAINLNFAPVGHLEVPVRVNTIGDPAAGYRAVVRVEPESVTLEGPEEQLEEIAAIFTETINLEGINANLRNQNVNLIAQVPFVTYSDTIVRVDIEVILQETTTRVDVPVIIDGPYRDRFALVEGHDSVQLLLRGPAAVLSDLNTQVVNASIDTETFQDRHSGSFLVRPEVVNLPDEVLIESTWPQQVRVEVTEPIYETIPIPLFYIGPAPLPPFLFQAGSLRVVGPPLPGPTEPDSP